ncbi:efflux RND transporter periplasmic adaptor subunit [Desulfuromonas sp. AOP6]|uniref:efflux RND transporter periplasmic adaptor subunit n=1 Tax=Desulfuromonas sp. AOP6 TaxID=1566351 RepID=UPI001270325C|nr:efflux RND transporter periplasmic adaptor subunit [Desulfuromonas sp. AOP6]BCA81176.1 MexX family efflux pump subunit [Desulfuromonas sp. AOP6]
MRTSFRRTIITLTGLLIAGLLLAGCEKNGPAGPQGARPAPEVSVLTVKEETVTLTTELPGRTAPRLIAEVRPQVGGIIQKRLFTEGSEVKAGQVLYQIDPAVHQAEYNSAQASLAQAEANFEALQLREERYRELVDMKAVSQQDYDDTRSAMKSAQAEIEAARAAVERARINLNYTQIKAPIAGRIGRSSVTTGALVTASQAAPLATIRQLDPMYVDVTQSAAELLSLKRQIAGGLVQEGDPRQAEVKLMLEDGTPYPLAGTLKFSEVTVEESTGSVTLRTLFPNPEQTLLPGLFVRAIVLEGVKEQAIMVPQRAVTRNPAGNAMVFVVTAEDKVAPRIIEVNRTMGDQWLVEKGLQAGDRVIMEGIQKARPGTSVKTVPYVTPDAAPQNTVPGN